VFVTRKYAEMYLLASACVYAFHISRNADRFLYFLFLQFVLRSFTKFFDPFLCSASSVVKFSSFATLVCYFTFNFLLISYINNSYSIWTPDSSVVFYAQFEHKSLNILGVKNVSFIVGYCQQASCWTVTVCCDKITRTQINDKMNNEYVDDKIL